MLHVYLEQHVRFVSLEKGIIHWAMLRLLHPLENSYNLFTTCIFPSPPAPRAVRCRYDQFVQNLNPGELVFPLTSVQPLTPFNVVFFRSTLGEFYLYIWLPESTCKCMRIIKITSFKPFKPFLFYNVHLKVKRRQGESCEDDKDCWTCRRTYLTLRSYIHASCCSGCFPHTKRPVSNQACASARGGRQ